MAPPLHVVVLAAGRGTRMRSGRPKVLHDVCGRPAVAHVLRAARALAAGRIALVTSPDLREELGRLEEAEGVHLVLQDPPGGTGHAVECALGAGRAADADEFVLVLYGDGPLYRPETLRRLVRALEGSEETAGVLLTAEVADPTGLGRVVRGERGEVLRIVEELEADEETRRIREIFPGVLAFRRALTEPLFARLGTDNEKGEKYLTDLVGLWREEGRDVGAVALDDPEEALAFNDLFELARVREAMRRRLVRSWMERGVDIVDPATTYLEVDVEIGEGTVIEPCSVIRRGVRIGRSCRIGPFAHLRLETALADGVEIGNFVEVKKSTVGAGSKAKHLTYLGDARIGAGANIGCGTITANWDGRAKHVTVIGDGAFVGSGTILVAPCEVAKGGQTGAGAVVRRGHRVGEGEVWVGVPARRLRRSNEEHGGEKG